jgi:putative ABC transport system substrate-binding protein
LGFAASTVAFLLEAGAGARAAESAERGHHRRHHARAAASTSLNRVSVCAIQERVGALFIDTDPLFTSRREQLVALASRNVLPASYNIREFVAAGGLMSYGTSLQDVYRQQGIYTARILNGDKATDLPVQQSTKVEFVLNLKTAKALGIKISDNLLSIADELIE